MCGNSRRFDAYCICTGAPTARDLPVPGRELKGIHPALDMLAQQNRILAGMTFPKEQLVTAKGKKYWSSAEGYRQRLHRDQQPARRLSVTQMKSCPSRP